MLPNSRVAMLEGKVRGTRGRMQKVEFLQGDAAELVIAANLRTSFVMRAG